MFHEIAINGYQEHLHAHYQGLIEKYQRSDKEMVNDSFPESPYLTYSRILVIFLHFALICHSDLSILLSDCWL